MALSERQLNRATLQRQLLLQRENLTVGEAIGRLVAIQAQEPAAPYVALWNRIEGFEPASLDDSFSTGEVVKASLMRITLHAVRAIDYPIFHQAMLATLRASRLNDRRFAESGMSIEDVDALIPHLLDFGVQPRTKTEIEAMLGERMGSEAHPRVWWALRTFAPMIHSPRGDVWSFGARQAFETAPPSGERPDVGTAVGTLFRRYLAGFGPASRQDFAQFAMLRQSTLKPVIESMTDLVTLEGPDGSEMYDLPDLDVPPADTPAPPRLMTMWDSTLLAYADRRRIIPETHRKSVIRNNGDVLPTVLIDGHVAGVWRHRGGTVEARLFEDIDPGQWAGLEVEAASLKKMVAERDDSVFGRYGRWWEKLPEGETRQIG